MFQAFAINLESSFFGYGGIIIAQDGICQGDFLRKIYITQYFANNTQIKDAASVASLICVLHINLILFYWGSVCIITQYFFQSVKISAFEKYTF